MEGKIILHIRVEQHHTTTGRERNVQKIKLLISTNIFSMLTLPLALINVKLKHFVFMEIVLVIVIILLLPYDLE